MAAMVLMKVEKNREGKMKLRGLRKWLAWQSISTQAQRPGFRSWHTCKSHVLWCVSVFPRSKEQDCAH